MAEPEPLDLVSVKTTLPHYPLPPNTERQPIYTNRLLIRAFNEDDADGIYALRCQPEVMQWSVQGRPDKDVEETREASLAARLPPHDGEMYDWAICLRDTGEMIGFGGMGCWKGELGWPVLGYMLRKEFWGRGFATEFLSAFVSAWWELPRVETDREVAAKTVHDDGGIVGSDGGALKRECITAVTTTDNLASQKVLRKVGFEQDLTFVEDDARDPTVKVTLCGFTAQRPL